MVKGKQAMYVAATLLAGTALTACGGGAKTYPTNIQTNFLNSCEVHSTVSRCGCMLSYIEARIALNTFEVADRAIRAGDTNYPSWLLDAASSCASK